MPQQLNPDGETYIGDVVLRTLDLTGIVEVYEPQSPGMRGEELTTEDFFAALTTAGVAEQLSVVISDHESLTPATGTRAPTSGDVIELDVPAPGDGFGQVLLYAAENGSLSWH